MTHDTQELVEELRKIGGHGFPSWADDAADALITQAEEIRALREILSEMQELFPTGQSYRGLKARVSAALAGKGEA